MDFANSKKFKTKILQERPEALRCGPVMRLLILAYCLLSLGYDVWVNRLLISPKRPLRGGTIRAEGFSALGAVDRSGEDGGVVFNVRGRERMSAVRAGCSDEFS